MDRDRQYLAFSRKQLAPGGRQSVGADLTAVAKDEGFRYHATIARNEGNISLRTRGERTSDIERDEFMAWTNGLWMYPGGRKSSFGHPAPFPLDLPRRCIRLFSFVEDTVLDPDYCRFAKRRLAADAGGARTPHA